MKSTKYNAGNSHSYRYEWEFFPLLHDIARKKVRVRDILLKEKSGEKKWEFLLAKF